MTQCAICGKAKCSHLGTAGNYVRAISCNVCGKYLSKVLANIKDKPLFSDRTALTDRGLQTTQQCHHCEMTRDCTVTLTPRYSLRVGDHEVLSR